MEMNSEELQVMIDRYSVLSNQDDRRMPIVFMRYGLCGWEKKTYDAIGKHFGVSGGRIRQIHTSNLNLLKHNNFIGRLTPNMVSILYPKGFHRLMDLNETIAYISRCTCKT